MGALDDPMAVVDPECRVIGVSGLRVIDTSIFPRITNGNLNGPAIMTAEKASTLGDLLEQSTANLTPANLKHAVTEMAAACGKFD